MSAHPLRNDESIKINVLLKLTVCVSKKVMNKNKKNIAVHYVSLNLQFMKLNSINADRTHAVDKNECSLHVHCTRHRYCLCDMIKY